MKKLLNRDMIFEWLNPVLGPNTVFDQDGCGSVIVNPSQNGVVPNDCYDDFLENPPAWLNPDSDEFQMKFDKEYIGAMYINGVPVTSWGALYGGSQYAQQKANVMTNFYDMAHFLKNIMDGQTIKPFFDDTDTFEISEITIQRMTPTESGIGLNIYLQFTFNKTELFGKFVRWGVNDKMGYQFICQPLKDGIPEEMWIKASGRLRKTLEAWFKPKSGIYKCLAKDIIVYSELGQIVRIKSGDVIEVTGADANRIKITWNDTKWQIKTPTYWWFKYYFQTVKN